jgi:hypothetical protein
MSGMDKNTQENKDQGKNRYRGNAGDDAPQFNPTFMMRTFIQIKEDRYDLDEIKSVEKRQRYCDQKEGLVYQILLNRLATVRNHIPYVEIEFDDEDERDVAVQLIYDKMDSVSNVVSV